MFNFGPLRLGIAQGAVNDIPELAQRLSDAYCAKYKSDGYEPKPDQWDNGGLYVFTPRQCLAWTTFFENPTKFIF